MTRRFLTKLLRQFSGAEAMHQGPRAHAYRSEVDNPGWGREPSGSGNSVADGRLAREVVGRPRCCPL